MPENGLMEAGESYQEVVESMDPNHKTPALLDRACGVLSGWWSLGLVRVQSPITGTLAALRGNAPYGSTPTSGEGLVVGVRVG